MKTKSISEVWYSPQNLRMLLFTKVDIPTSAEEASDFKSLAYDYSITLTTE